MEFVDLTFHGRPVHRSPTLSSDRQDWILGAAIAPMAPFYVKNRRDGSRLLSTALVVCAAGLMRFDHPSGRAIFLVAAGVSVYWGFCYGRLER